MDSRAVANKDVGLFCLERLCMLQVENQGASSCLQFL